MNGNYQYNQPYYYNQNQTAASLTGQQASAQGQQAQQGQQGQDYYRYPQYPNYPMYQQPGSLYYQNGQGAAAATATAASTASAAPVPAATGLGAPTLAGTPIPDTLNAQLALTVGQFQPPGIRPRVTTTMWEDEKTLCYQVDANNVLVVRRADNNMINGTKLLNVAQMTRGRRDGILKLEKVRHVVKIGLMHLKGVWIPFERALAMAQREGIVDLLYPLFMRDIKRVIQTGVTPNTAGAVKAALLTPPTQQALFYQGTAPQSLLEYALYSNGSQSHALPSQPAAQTQADPMKMYQGYGQQQTQQQPYYQNALYYQQQPYAGSLAPNYLAYNQGTQMYGYLYGQAPQQPQAAALGTPQQPVSGTPQQPLGTPQQPALGTPQQPAADAKKDEEK